MYYCTLYLGVLEHTPQNTVWSKFSENFLLSKYIYEYLSSMFIWGLFAAFSPCWGLFAPFSACGGPFLGLTPPRTKIYVGAHEYMIFLRTSFKGMGGCSPQNS